MCNSDKRHNSTVCHALPLNEQRSAPTRFNQTQWHDAKCSISCGERTDVRGLHHLGGNTGLQQLEASQ